jgi:tripartite-type tricarboxylate transporter receptor subunit TctC
MKKTNRRIAILALSCLSALFAHTAQAQGTASDYPNKPIRFVVSNAAGGLHDTIARAVAQHYSERLGQPVVVDNRPGASEIIASELVAKSPADGYTLLVASDAAMVFNPILMKKIPYSPQRDFTPISMIAETPLYLIVNPALPAKTVNELIALAKAQPGKITFASIGTGSMQYLLGEMFKTRVKVDLLHVPYKSSSAAVLDIVSGRVDMMFQGGGGTLAHIRSGKLRALAATSATRPEETQNLPTMMEAGVPNFEGSPWFAVFGPAGLPRPIVDRLNREVGELMRAPETRKKLAPLGIKLIPGTPEELSEHIRKDGSYWTKVIRDARIEPE